MYKWKLLLTLLLAVLTLNNVAYAKKTIKFPHRCTSGRRLLIAAVGDVLLHKPLQNKAHASNFESLWSPVTPYIKQADMAYANLEGPMAYGVNRRGRVVNHSKTRIGHNIYSSYPLFNYHPSLAKALVSSGFDIVSTANNHTLDRFGIGVDRTVEVLGDAGLAFSGTRRKHSQAPWYAIVKKKGFKIAWISCTATTNGMRDHAKQVLYCYKRHDRSLIVTLIKKLKHKTDAVIVTPHWGTQYHHQPNSQQRRFAHQMLNAGALMVIGNHPHVLQPLKKFITKDGRSTLIAYSLGNFVSYQGTPKNRTTVVLLLGLTKTRRGVVINQVGYIPAYMQNRSGMKKLHLTLINQHQRSIGLNIIKKIYPIGNMLTPTTQLKKQFSCG